MCSWLVVSNLNATQMKSLIKSQTSPCFVNRRNSSCLWILFVWFVLSISGYPSIRRSSLTLCWGSCWPSSQLPSAPPGLRGSSQPSSGSCWPARIIFCVWSRWTDWFLTGGSYLTWKMSTAHTAIEVLISVELCRPGSVTTSYSVKLFNM